MSYLKITCSGSIKPRMVPSWLHQSVVRPWSDSFKTVNKSISEHLKHNGLKFFKVTWGSLVIRNSLCIWLIPKLDSTPWIVYFCSAQPSTKYSNQPIFFKWMSKRANELFEHSYRVESASIFTNLFILIFYFLYKRVKWIGI